MERVKRGKKIIKGGFVVMMALMLLPLLFLPLGPIRSGGSFEVLFVGTVFFALLLFIAFGALARHYSHVEGENLYNVQQAIERLEKDAEGYNRGEEEKNLSREDRELMNSLRQLKRWYQEALVQEQKLKDFQRNKRALEKWYRMGIKKSIDVRDLKQQLKEGKGEEEESLEEPRP